MLRLYTRLVDLLRGKTTSNFIHLSLNQGVNIVTALILNRYLFQTLGEEQYGLVSVALSVVLLFGMLVNYGFNLNIPQKLAIIKESNLAKQDLINEVTITKLILSCMVAVLVIFSTNHFGLFEGYSVILTYSVIQLFSDALYPMAILQGFDKLSWIAKANAVSKLLYLGLVILVVNVASDAKWVNFLLGSTGFLVHGSVMVLIYRAESIRLQWVAFSRIKFWLWSNFQFFFSTVASYILINGGLIILKNFVNDAELGFYSLGQKVAVMLRMIPIFITQSIIHNASRLYDQDKISFEGYLQKSQRNGLLITALICFTAAASSKWVIRILAGEFIPLSATLMSILCLLPIIGMLNVSNMIRILVADQKYILSKAIWITTGLMLIFSLIGSYYFGSYGLAVSLVLAEIFNYFIHYILLKRAGLGK
ncbi:MAG: oligosaccharide flippase family protein [Oceanospirillaceae bacterium]|nr:oligosaccharide flippase family protein [Oceanospirillaceae bacterium]